MKKLTLFIVTLLALSSLYSSEDDGEWFVVKKGKIYTEEGYKDFKKRPYNRKRRAAYRAKMKIKERRDEEFFDRVGDWYCSHAFNLTDFAREVVLYSRQLNGPEKKREMYKVDDMKVTVDPSVDGGGVTFEADNLKVTVVGCFE